MENLSKVDVYYQDHLVGTIARSKEGSCLFEYADAWFEKGFALNPLNLPLEKRVFVPERNPLDGVFGVFNDSLPDGWGRLLVDRMLRSHGYIPEAIDALMRLSIVGASGMGALEYRPQWEPSLGVETQGNNYIQSNFDHLSRECTSLLSQSYSSDLDTLFVLGGSSGGARPKILTEINGESWIIKFPSTFDPADIGQQEYDYMICAQECGIEVPAARLFRSDMHSGYFGVKRFDRIPRLDRIANGNLPQDRHSLIRESSEQKVHMISVAGLLETTHRIPNLDYLDLMNLTSMLTNDFNEMKKLYRLMCFNVFAHNRDDHSKNFSFLYDSANRTWSLSPAYDLTYSSSIRGEHATTVAGNGKDPDIDDVLRVAEEVGLSSRWARKIAEDIKQACFRLIRLYRH